MMDWKMASIYLFAHIFKSAVSGPSKIGILWLLGSTAALAGPVTTVPWNGHTGAVSLTYDDARSSQIPNLLPQLDALGIKATFFIAVNGTGGDFAARRTEWIQAAVNGHELANHTMNHVNLPADPNAASIINEMANYLRALDPVVESVTFAYPNCNINGKNGVSSEDFIGRGCGQTSYLWGAQPSDWMNIQGLILTPTNVSTAINMLNAARSGNSWVTTIVHDVKTNPDAYSLTPSDNQRMLDAAVSNSLWIDTYQRIAAYYRAHFTLDAVTAIPTPQGWNLTWTSPHPKMPNSVNLRVTLDSATFGTDINVQQNGAAIAQEADGTYVIDFMRLSLTVLRNPSGVLSPAFLPLNLNARAVRDGIVFSGVVGEVEAIVVDVRGNTLFRGPLSDHLVPLRNNQLQGILFLTLVNRAGASVRAMVNATH